MNESEGYFFLFSLIGLSLFGTIYCVCCNNPRNNKIVPI